MTLGFGQTVEGIHRDIAYGWFIGRLWTWGIDMDWPKNSPWKWLDLGVRNGFQNRKVAASQIKKNTPEESLLRFP